MSVSVVMLTAGRVTGVRIGMEGELAAMPDAATTSCSTLKGDVGVDEQGLFVGSFPTVCLGWRPMRLKNFVRICCDEALGGRVAVFMVSMTNSETALSLVETSKVMIGGGG